MFDYANFGDQPIEAAWVKTEASEKINISKMKTYIVNL